VIRRATVVAVGRLKGWAADGCEDYLSRLRRYFPVEIIEVPEEDMNRRPANEVLATEGERLLKRLPAGAYVIALDREKGRQLSSEEFARKLGSLGVSGLEKADERLSLGNITLPHALARVVLLEQIYRAVKIERGEKYHW
jgi:23S rRNA (pseudouridine1915-N3)-methyltransferase